MYFKRELDDSEKLVLQKIKVDYFRDTPNFPIKVVVDIEGQTLDENRNFVIGCCAGPSCDIPNLLHEMGHFAEREIDKLKKRPYSAWGYTFGKYWEVCGKSGYEPFTDQSVRRELRIWAFQYNLQLLYGLDSKVENIVSSAVYLPAFLFYQKRLPDHKKLELAKEEVLELSKTFTIDAFNKAWWERIEVLQKQKRKVPQK